jgi:hypothetical protein
MLQARLWNMLPRTGHCTSGRLMERRPRRPRQNHPEMLWWGRCLIEVHGALAKAFSVQDHNAVQGPTLHLG